MNSIKRVNTINYNEKLFIACSDHNIESVKIALDHGANVNCIYSNCTPLGWASFVGDYDIVELLLERGADISMTDALNRTALILAISSRYWDIVKGLVKAGANVNTVDVNGECALLYACYYGIPEQIEFLLDAGANPNDVFEYSTLFSNVDAEKKLLGSIILQRTVRRKRCITTILALKHRGMCRDVANLMGTLMWKSRN